MNTELAEPPDAPGRILERNPEPQSIEEAIRPWLTGVADPATTAHPHDGCCKACAELTPPVRTVLDAPWRQLDPRWSKGWFAVNCCEACYEAARVDTSIARRNRENWAKKCPPEFRRAWDPARGNQALFDQVKKWHPKNGRGLVIHGDSGAGKTHVVWARLDTLAQEGWGFEFYHSLDLTELTPPEAAHTPILILDDLGNDIMNQRHEVRLLRLIAERVNWHRPIIVTTQSNSTLLAERFSDSGTAKAVLRRLREYCDPIYARGRA